LNIEASSEAFWHGEGGQSALTQLRAYLAQRELPPEARLPPERELSEILGVSRGELRKALAILEGQGELWRHVGKGTFVGARPVLPSDAGLFVASSYFTFSGSTTNSFWPFRVLSFCVATTLPVTRARNMGTLRMRNP